MHKKTHPWVPCDPVLSVPVCETSLRNLYVWLGLMNFPKETQSNCRRAWENVRVQFRVWLHIPALIKGYGYILPWKLSLQDGLLELQSIPIVTERVKLIRVKPTVTDFQQFPDDLTHLATLEVFAKHGLVRVGRKCYPVYGRDNKRDNSLFSIGLSGIHT